jgi:hypothetical protein
MNPNKKSKLTRMDVAIIYLCETVHDIPTMCAIAVILLISLYAADMISVDFCANITFIIMIIFTIYSLLNFFKKDHD